MRPSGNETYPIGGSAQPRKSSFANSGDPFTPSTTAMGSGSGPTPSAEELHPAGSSASMKFFLADEAIVNASAAMVGSSASIGSAGGFGVHSLSSSGGQSVPGSIRKSKGIKRRSSANSEENNSRLEDNPSSEVAEAEDSIGRSTNKGNDMEYEDGDRSIHSRFDREKRLDGNAQNIYDSTSPRLSMSHQSALELPDSPFLGLLKSPRSCDDFSEAASQAVVSGGEEDDLMLTSPVPSSSPSSSPRHRGRMAASEMMDSMVPPPQFIMPTIRMPSRRPFTDRGKRIGRLKILIAGDSGIGKTSLIKSIVQNCEDIVHVDPLATEHSARRNSRTATSSSSYNTLSGKVDNDCTKKITEIYASTKPYPKWWSEHEDSRVLRRRKSTSAAGDVVLERNLCFVDTPGYGSGTSFSECVEPVVRYVESQMERTAMMLQNGEGDMLSLLSGNGTPQVDVVFYVILHRLKPVDVEYIRRLSPLTNVLPVIAKADSLTSQQIKSLKLSILSDLRAAGIQPFLFGKGFDDVLSSVSGICAPFAISSAISNDQENMDASVLMSPDYNPPLIDVELGELVSHVFEPANIAWLKHLTAKKYIKWASRGSSSSQYRGSLLPPSRPDAFAHNRSLSSSTINQSSSSISLASSPPPPNFTLARIADHTQREERFAQARLARWANDLQRSMKAERERYERLAKGERAIWLTERLNECVIDGQLVPVSMALTKPKSENTSSSSTARSRIKATEESGAFSAKDPLGILGILHRMGKRACVLQYGGSIFAVATAVWAVRNYGLGFSDFKEWVGFLMK